MREERRICSSGNCIRCNFPYILYCTIFCNTLAANKKNLQQLFQDFLLQAEYVRKARPSTLHGYFRAFAIFNSLIPNLTLDHISINTINEFFKTLHERKRIVGKGIVKSGIKKSTVATYWSKLSAFFSWLESNNHIEKNPLKNLKCPVPTYEDKKFLNREDIERILTAIHIRHGGNVLLFKRNLLLLHLLIYCGLRKEELIHLKIPDIDFERKTATVRAATSKSGRTRLLPLNSATVMHLQDYLRQRKGYTTPYLLVSSSRDDKLTYNGLKHLVEKLRKASGVQFHLHQLRHTFAVNFLRSSNNIFKLQLLLGHRDVRTTVLYLRCLPQDELQKDIESLSIDNFL